MIGEAIGRWRRSLRQLRRRTREAELRARVVAAARGELGRSDPAPYWRSALGRPGPYPPAWCGAFALWCLHQAGLGTGRHWTVGCGISSLLPPGAPAVGGVAYYRRGQHHAVIARVGRETIDTIDTIDGNGPGGVVVERRAVPLGDVTVTYSIDPWIQEALA